jgi:3-phenylpropionate/cinnamic acid dioxygenase small subunit
VTDELAAKLDRLESRGLIEDLVSNYCHGFDKRDYDRFLSIWWDDCVWKIGPPFGDFSGHEGIHQAIHEVLWPAWAQSQHVTSNLVVEFTSPDSASGICDVDCMGLLSDSTDATFVGATYRDRFERREGVWKMREREVVIHHFNGFPGTQLTKPEAI